MVWSRRIPLLIAFTALVAGLVLFFALHLWIPGRHLSDPDWLRTASRDDMRNAAHRVIRWPIGNHHDAFLVLRWTGNGESIPLLIRALTWHETDGRDFTPCTTDHCLEALRSLTGHDAGSSAAEWRRWWESTGSRRDPSSFHTEEAGDTEMEIKIEG